MASILVVAAHPDDEILGCGGVLARHAAEGDTVHVLIVAEGATARDSERDPRGRKPELTALRAAASRAAAAIGAEEPRILGLPDNRLDSLPLLDVSSNPSRPSSRLWHRRSSIPTTRVI